MKAAVSPSIQSANAIGLGLLTTLFAATSLAGVSVPNTPLQTGSRVPPNILFILDDSGSMEGTAFDEEGLPAFTGGGLSASALNTMSLA